MNTDVEIHIPISPTPAFFQQVHYLLASLRERGGVFSHARVVVTVGEDCEPFDIARRLPWSVYYPVSFRWVPRDLFRRSRYQATSLQRWRYDFQAPFVMMLDADIIVARDFSELLDRMLEDPGLYGMIAHSSPWANSGLLNEHSEHEWWDLTFREAGLLLPKMDCEYTAFGTLTFDPETRFCPPYFNFGALIAPASIMTSIGSVVFDLHALLTRVTTTRYRCQIALTLAILRLNIPWRTLPLRYNFTPGFRAYMTTHPQEWEQVRLLHYTCTPEFDKNALMGSYENLGRWANEPGVSEVDQALRQAFAPIHAAVLRDLQPSPELSRNEQAEERQFELIDSKQAAAWQNDLPRLASGRAVHLEYPFAVFNIELTNRCPLKCIMCARTADMTRPEGLMDIGLFRRAVDELAAANPNWSRTVPVRLHGFGESLVHPLFDECIRYAESKGVNTCLSINPIMLRDEIARRLLDAAPSLLYISLDGHDDESFERIRGVPNAYGRSKANLLGFLARKVERGVRTKVVLSMIEFPLNERSIAEVQAYWSTVEGLDEFRTKPFCTWDGSSDGIRQLVGLNQAATNDGKREVTCKWPWIAMTILWDGTVVPCCFDFDGRYVLGDLNRSSLAEIWNGSPMKTLRQEFKSGVVTNPLCRNCDSLTG